MSVYLNEGAPDEPLFSMVASYGKQMLVTDWKMFVSGLFGYGARFNTGLAYNLDEVAQQTRVSLGMSAMEIAERLTLFPYYARFCSRLVRRRLLSRIMKWSSTHQRGDVQKLIQRPHVIRFCRSCASEDRSSGRVATWKRCHQLPGVFVCPRHGAWLFEYPVNVQPYSAWPTLADVKQAVPVEFGVTKSQQIAIRRVADRSASLLCDTGTNESSPCEGGWLELARSCGYARGKNTLESALLCKDLIDTFGENYLSRCNLLPSGRQNWVLGRVLGGQSSSAALPEVLLRAFFEIRGSISSEHWPVCPSRYAAHGPDHKTEVRTRSHGKLFCYCRCGMSFVKHVGADGTDPVISVYGEPYAAEALRLANGGLSGAEIARTLGVSETTARNLTGRSQRYARSSVEATAARAAHDWKAAVGSAGTVSVVQKERDGLYRRVRRFDPEVLESTRGGAVEAKLKGRCSPL
ncbi:TniQ family protein [Paraburkholderia youngii]|uniref:TnsD family Tn7-like transposition protein n=1 Tax=Paraburkholderia youngii TaxID=2782701 RepID=UPI003D2168A8